MQSECNWLCNISKIAILLTNRIVVKILILDEFFHIFQKKPIVDAPEVSLANIKLTEPPAYKKGDSLATRQAYGTALVKIGKNNPRVVGLDGDMKNSTFSQELRKLYPER